MQKHIKLKNIITGLLLLFVQFSFAAIEKTTERIPTTSTPVTIGSTQLADIGAPYSSPAVFSDVAVSDKITLGVDYFSDKYLTTTGEIKVTFLLEKWDAAGVLTTSTPDLILKYEPFSATNPYIDKTVLTFNGAYKFKITITNITVAGVIVTNLPVNLYIDSDILIERYYNFSSSATSPMPVNPLGVADTIDLDCNSIVDEIQITWPSVMGAEEYQLEWTFVNNYGTSSTTFLSATASKYDFKNNSTRITTTDLFYKITNIFEHGFLVYRIRPIGRDYLNPSKIIVGVWSNDGSGSSVVDNNYVNFVSSRYYITYAHEADKNWQYSATFAEEGKKKEVISYFDGSLRNRQSVTKVNSEGDKNAIVGETIYDYQGRPALNVLPVPVPKSTCVSPGESSLKYYETFNKVDATNSYDRTNFDQDPSIADSCSTTTLGMDPSSGATNYYSPYNTNKVGAQAFVPNSLDADEKGFPFTQIEYTPDNTGRIRRQGGVGPDYQLDKSHETKYFYGWPNQVQLDRLFGSEVGDAAHYKKNLVIDANGQVSVSYLDQEGRTIATSLAGNAPKDASGNPILEPLESESDPLTTKNLNIDLFAKDANGVSSVNKINQVPDAIVFTSQLLVTYQSNFIFDYSLDIDAFPNACLAENNICFNCVYDLEIKITDDCGKPVISSPANGQPIQKPVGKFNADVNGNILSFKTICEMPSNYNLPESFTLNSVPVGNYTISKILTVNHDARDFYVQTYLDPEQNPCTRSLDDFIADALAGIDTSDCNITCEKCAEALMKGYPTVTEARDAWVADGNGTALDFDILMDECGKPCREINWCEATYEQLLLDVSPDGQYAQFQTTAAGSAPDLALSVLNVGNVLPKNVGSTPIGAHWQNPDVIVNGNHYGYYLQDDGSRSIIKVNPLGTNYVPAVVNTSTAWIKYDAVAGYYYTYPQNLANVSDFVSKWENSWAKSLVQYHPEYCYYEACEKYNKHQGTDKITSDGFDSLLTNSRTFQEAFAAKLINTNYTTGVASINKIYDIWTYHANPVTDPFDPFVTNTVFDDFGTPGYPYTQLHNKFLNYKTFVDNAGIPHSYSMPDLAAMTVRCGTLYGTTPSASSSCVKFGTDVFLPGTDPANQVLNDSIRDLEWNMFKNFYLAEKRKLQQFRADEFAKIPCSGYNGCIGNDNYNPFLAGMVNFPYGSAYFASLYFRVEQPCSAFFHTLYTSKKKRFINNSDIPSPSQEEVDYQMYLQTGQCPQAIDLQYLMSAIAGHHELTNTTGEDLPAYGEFTFDLYTEVSGGTAPATFVPYLWKAVSGITGDVLSVNIINSITNTVACNVVLDKTGTGIINWSDIASISQLTYTATLGGMYEFDATAAISDGLGSISGYKTIKGSSCIKINGCNFPPQCEPNDIAVDLSNLWSALIVNDRLASPVTALDISNEQYKDFITTPIKNKLGTINNSLEWKYIGGNQFVLDDATAPSKKITIKFTTFSPATFTVSNLYTNGVRVFANIKSNNSNFFTVDGLDEFNNVIVTINGSAEFFNGTTTSGVSMGECGKPSPLACQEDPYKLTSDLEDLLEDVLLQDPFTGNINLTESTYFSNLLQDYFPSGLASTSSVVTTSSAGGTNSETLTFTIASPVPADVPAPSDPLDPSTPSVNEQNEAAQPETCELILTHSSTGTLYSFSDLVSFENLTAYGTPDLDGSYHTFYAIAVYSSGGSSYSDTIFGTSCLPLKNCNPCSSAPPAECVTCKGLSIQAPDPICVKQPATFGYTLDECNGTPELLWNFGDGTVSSIATHNYLVPGNYTVSLSSVRRPECHGLKTLYAEVNITVSALCSGTVTTKDPIYYNRQDSIDLANGMLVKDTTIDLYKTYSAKILVLDSINGWTAGDTAFVEPVDYSDFYVKGDKHVLESHNQFIEYFDSTIDNKNHLRNIKSFISDYGSYTNSVKEYERYTRAINKYNQRAVSYGAPSLTAIIDTNFYGGMLSDSNRLYIRYLKDFPENGLTPLDETSYLTARGSLPLSSDTCAILYKKYTTAYKNFAVAQAGSNSCPGYEKLSPLYSYEDFVKSELCGSSVGLVTFNNYILSFSSTIVCPSSMPVPITDDKTCQRLYILFIQAIADYNSSVYALAHSHSLDKDIYPTYESFVRRGLCDCISAYTKYLQQYISAPAGSTLPLPVDVDHYSGCLTPAPPVEDPCKDAYNNYAQAVADYNEFVIKNDALKLPPIRDIYKPEDFTAEGFCYCVDAYVAFIQTIIDGTADLSIEHRTELYLQLDIANNCAPQLKPPCNPSIAQDTILSPPFTHYTNPCAEYMIAVATENATNAYNQYVDSLTTFISAAYTTHCLGAVENFKVNYNDKEYHFTLYYYDQAGNLVRTIPPEGVHLVDMNDPLIAGQINSDRTNNTHTYFTSHTLPTTYQYNSLNQLVRQNMPDHDQMDIFDYALTNGLDSRLKVTGTQFVNTMKGYLTGTVDVGTTKRGYLYTSDDGGATWVKMNDLVASDLKKVQMVDAAIGYAVGNHGIILKTIDAGNSWDLLKQLYSSGAETHFTDLYFINATHGIVLADNDKYQITTDGINYSTGSLPVFLKEPSITYDGVNFYVSGINSVSGLPEMYKSTTINTSTMAINWSATPLTVRSTDLSKIQLLQSSRTDGYAVGVDGTLMRTLNSGANWRTLPTGKTGTFKDIYFKTPAALADTVKEGVAIIEDVVGQGQIYKTTNGGYTWTLISDPGDYYNSFNFYQNDKGYVVGEAGLMKRVVMTGLYGLVNMATGISPSFNIKAASFSDADRGMIVGTDATGTNAKIYYTINGTSSSALHFEPITTTVPGSFNDIYFGTVYSGTGAGTNNNGILLDNIGKAYKITATPPASNTYSILSMSTSENFTNIDDSPTSVFGFDKASGQLKSVLKSGITTASSLSTVSISTGTPPTSLGVVSIFAKSSGAIFAVGLNGELFKADLGVSQWNDYSKKVTPLPLHDIQAVGTDVIYAVGSEGTLLQATNGIDFKTLPTATIVQYNAIKFNTDNTVAAPANYLGLIAGNAGTLMQNTVTGSSVVLAPFVLTTSENLYDIAIAPSNLAYAGGGHGTVVSIPTITSLASFVELLHPSQNFNGMALVLPIAASGASPVIAVGNSAAVYNYNGGSGAKIKSVFTPGLNDVHFISTLNGYTVGEKDIIRHTADGGLTWQYVLPAQKAFGGGGYPEFAGVFTTQPNVAIVIGENKYISNIAGATGTTAVLNAYSSSATPGSPNLNDIAMNGSTGYIVGDNGTSLKLISGVWGNVAGSAVVHGDLRAIHVFTNNNFITVGKNKKIWVFNGTTWIDQTFIALGTVAAGTDYSDVFFHDDRTGYIVGYVAPGGSGSVLLKCTETLNVFGLATNTIEWKVRPLTGVNGISNPTDVDIETIDFSSRYNGFIGGAYNTTTPTPNVARRIHDESGMFSTRFWYDRLGRMVVSQNTKQYNRRLTSSSGTLQDYSYTIYDELGRIFEVGEKTDTVTTVGTVTNFSFNSIFGEYVGDYFNPEVIKDSKLKAWVYFSGRREVTNTYYDVAVITGIPAQENLRKRVSSVTYQDVAYTIPPLVDQTYQHATHYSYDIHGNVKTLWQENPTISLASQRLKRVDYEYDLISGKVNLVRFQDGEPDAFYHFYEYDADNRIIAVYSSRYPQANTVINDHSVNGNPLWENDAKYFYYAHGPLARVEVGNNAVQGMDYAYTLQGWIKGVNSNTLDKTLDIGQDGKIGGIYNPSQPDIHKNFAYDAYGYTLNYRAKDYEAIEGLRWNSYTDRFEAKTVGSDLEAAKNDLFNGNITAMATTIKSPKVYTNAPNEFPVILPLGTAYKYDQLNRIKEMQAYANLDMTSTSPNYNTWGTGSVYSTSNLYHNKFNYDANGNITLQERADGAGVIFDRLKYNYNLDALGNISQNRLYSVNETPDALLSLPAPTNGLATDDIDDQGVFDPTVAGINTNNNYRYDEIGNLKHDEQEQIQNIEWTVYGKIKRITRTSGSLKSDLEFNYDASGNRISKIEKPRDGTGVRPSIEWITTFYARDAQGNTMTTYKQAAPSSTPSFKVIERNVFGSSRLGTENTEVELTTLLPVANPFDHTAGNRYYEENNHLGNVLVVFSDRKIPRDDSGDGIIDYSQPDIINTYDYSAFGAPLKERTLTKQICTTTSTTTTTSVLGLETFTSGTGSFVQMSSVTLLTNSAGMLKVEKTAGSGTLGAKKNFTTIASQLHTISFDFDKGDLTAASTVVCRVYDPASVLIFTSASFSATASYSFTFTSTSAGSYRIEFERVTGSGNKYFLLDNILIAYNTTVGTTVCVDASKYRYGFNGKEKDDEAKGAGNSYDYGERLYDPRIGRWISPDPKGSKLPGISTYVYALCSPLLYTDSKGELPKVAIILAGASVKNDFDAHVKALEAQGYKVVRAETGKEALRLMNMYSSPDSPTESLILLSHGSPGGASTMGTGAGIYTIPEISALARADWLVRGTGNAEWEEYAKGQKILTDMDDPKFDLDKHNSAKMEWIDKTFNETKDEKIKGYKDKSGAITVDDIAGSMKAGDFETNNLTVVLGGCNEAGYCTPDNQEIFAKTVAQTMEAIVYASKGYTSEDKSKAVPTSDGKTTTANRITNGSWMKTDATGKTTDTGKKSLNLANPTDKK